MISFIEQTYSNTEINPNFKIALYRLNKGKDPMALITKNDVEMSKRSKSYLTQYNLDNKEFTNIWVNTGFSFDTNSVLRYEYNPKPRIVIGDYKKLNVDKDYIKMVDLEQNSPIL